METGIPRQEICECLRAKLKNLLAIYIFGSRAGGVASQNSDLDLAVLLAGYADPLLLWDLGTDLADISNCDVDLLDFRAVPTTVQYQILTGGLRWWAADFQADLYEAAVLNDKIWLDTLRSGILADISRTGRIYGCHNQ